MKRLVMEFIGTFFLPLTIAFGGGTMALGIMLMAMIYMGEHISGGHFNPAVSLISLFRRKMNFVTFFQYATAQTMGALAAAALIYVISNKIYYIGVPNNVMLWKAGIIEILATFVFCSVIIAVSNVTRLKNSAIFGIAIGLTLISIASMSASISGSCFNPALCLGTGLFDFMLNAGSTLKQVQTSSLMLVMRENMPLIKQTLMYVLAPSFGSFVAVHCYRYLNNEK